MSEKVEITICMGSSCFARGNAQNLEFVEKYIADQGLNARIELVGSRCEGKCDIGPNIVINGVAYSQVDEKKLKELLDVLNKI